MLCQIGGPVVFVKLDESWLPKSIEMCESECRPMRIFWQQVLFAALSIVLLAGCERENQNSATRESETKAVPLVCVTNYPLQYFAQRIGGDFVQVEFPLPGDGDPVFWHPDSKGIARFQEADLIVTNGATYEKWLVTATLPDEKIVDTSAGFRDKFIQIEGDVVHSHGPEGEHSHTGTAFTTWIDFDQAAQQATAIHDAFAKLIPDRKADLDNNLQALLTDLKQLDQEMLAVGQQLGDRPLVVSHPIYQYLARRYSLNLKAVLWEPDVVPSNEALAELKTVLESHPAQAMIWEGTPADESVEKLDALGLTSLVFDPCANVSDSGDWLEVMRANIQGLRRYAEARGGVPEQRPSETGGDNY